eukprot:1176797-Prorocentrum_minimum.AAC.7
MWWLTWRWQVAVPPEDRTDAVVLEELMVCFNGVMRGAVVDDPDPNWVAKDDPVRCRRRRLVSYPIGYGGQSGD